ncbi:MAG: hypothetical protein FWC52_01320 [Candidatus Methanoplasma sp.]|nr:hypothetical protein [Candidatus Methanoplasma sp.]
MGIRNIFKRRERPSTEGLQSGEQKNMKTQKVILPPMDENGRWIQDRPINGKR